MLEAKETYQKSESSFFTDIISVIDNKKPEPVVSRSQQTANLSLIDEQNQQFFARRGDLIVETLNQFISSGVMFYVSENDFETIGRQLSKPEKEYLAGNSNLILCFLQQSLLQKKMFSVRKDLFDEFAESIYEREAVLMESGKAEGEAYFVAIQMQTRTWFARLLDAN